MKWYTSRDIKRLIQRIRDNEEIALKFFEVETSILSTLSFQDFFEQLLSKIMEKFSVGFVWVTLIDKSSAVRLINAYASSAVPEGHLKILDRRHFKQLIPDSRTPILKNDDLGIFKPLLPKGAAESRYHSLAIIPISLDGEAVGSLNFADMSKERFSPETDTSLLEQMGLVVSICLSNVAAHEELKSLAFKDPLTGLLNRRAMERALKREINRSRRYNSTLSVVFIDLDGFKKVNDVYGHDSGDDLLIYVAGCLKNMCRESDIISRFAGDEFVLILPQASLEEAGQLIERIREHFRLNPFSSGVHNETIAFSCGVVSPFHNELEDAASVLKKADELMYRDKAERKLCL